MLYEVDLKAVRMWVELNAFSSHLKIATIVPRTGVAINLKTEISLKFPTRNLLMIFV